LPVVSDVLFAADLAVTPAGLVRAKVKWFNVEKGFGFVTPLDGAAEAFLHASVLSRCGLAPMAEGTEVLCEVVGGAKGPQVVRVVEVLEAPAEPEPPLDVVGTVKWYQPDKGFGFVTTDDGGRDVFLHKSALKRSGVDGLESGQMLMMAVHATVKGREVRRFVLL
jgi:CspA family cold shock protein